MKTYFLVVLTLLLTSPSYSADANSLLPPGMTKPGLEKLVQTRMMDRYNDNDFINFDSVEVKSIRNANSIITSIFGTDDSSYDVRVIELITVKNGKRLDLQCEMNVNRGSGGGFINNCLR